MICISQGFIQISSSARLFTPVFVFTNTRDAPSSYVSVLLSVLLLPGNQIPPNKQKGPV